MQVLAEEAIEDVVPFVDAEVDLVKDFVGVVKGLAFTFELLEIWKKLHPGLHIDAYGEEGSHNE